MAKAMINGHLPPNNLLFSRLDWPALPREQFILAPSPQEAGGQVQRHREQVEKQVPWKGPGWVVSGRGARGIGFSLGWSPAAGSIPETVTAIRLLPATATTTADFRMQWPTTALALGQP